jgi:hypothetical protein
VAACSQECLAPQRDQAHCAGCHRTFGAVSGFDVHRRAGRCSDPASIGLVAQDGVWQSPATAALTPAGEACPGRPALPMPRSEAVVESQTQPFRGRLLRTLRRAVGATHTPLPAAAVDGHNHRA